MSLVLRRDACSRATCQAVSLVSRLCREGNAQISHASGLSHKLGVKGGVG